MQNLVDPFAFAFLASLCVAISETSGIGVGKPARENGFDVEQL